MKLTLLMLSLFFSIQLTFSQSMDFNFQILLVDDNKIVDCGLKNNHFEIYSCSADYSEKDLQMLNSGVYSWRIPSEKIRINNALVCEAPINDDSTKFPFEKCYGFSSVLETQLLMIVKNKTDTMWIQTIPSESYSFVLSYIYYPSGYQKAVPYTILFKKGYYTLYQIISDEKRTYFNNLLYNQFINSTKHLYSIDRIYPQNISNQKKDTINIIKLDREAQINSISHASTNKKSYYPLDTLLIDITGFVMLNGACAGGQLIWTLQKKTEDIWINATTEDLTQMDCGMPYKMVNNQKFFLFILSNKTDTNTWMTKYFESGNYRFVIYDKKTNPFYSNVFSIIQK